MFIGHDPAAALAAKEWCWLCRAVQSRRSGREGSERVFWVWGFRVGCPSSGCGCRVVAGAGGWLQITSQGGVWSRSLRAGLGCVARCVDDAAAACRTENEGVAKCFQGEEGWLCLGVEAVFWFVTETS